MYGSRDLTLKAHNLHYLNPLLFCNFLYCSFHFQKLEPIKLLRTTKSIYPLKNLWLNKVCVGFMLKTNNLYLEFSTKSILFCSLNENQYKTWNCKKKYSPRYGPLISTDLYIDHWLTVYNYCTGTHHSESRQNKAILWSKWLFLHFTYYHSLKLLNWVKMCRYHIISLIWMINGWNALKSYRAKKLLSIPEHLKCKQLWTYHGNWCIFH